MSPIHGKEDARAGLSNLLLSGRVPTYGVTAATNGWVAVALKIALKMLPTARGNETTLRSSRVLSKLA